MRRQTIRSTRSVLITLALVSPVLLALAVCLSPPARADDWPQWLGPWRDGVWREKGVSEAFARDGLKVRWRAPVAAGYSGPAVVDGRVFVTDRVVKPGSRPPGDQFRRQEVPGTERVLCLNEADGKVLWTFEYDCPYTVSYAAGPRATPTVDGERVYALGAEGHLHCLDAATGKVVWAKRLAEGVPAPVWGYAAHPLVDGELLICTTPKQGAIATAWDKRTGEVRWEALSAGKGPGYSPPVAYDVAGRRQLIVWHGDAVNSLDPRSGKVYWTVPFGPARYGATIITPLLLRDEKLGDLLFVSGEYEGAMMLKLERGGDGEPAASALWKRIGKSNRNTDALHILMSTPVLRDGHVYGVDSRGQLRCLEAGTGDRLWETQAATTYDAGPQTWATAFLTPVGEEAAGRCLIANEHGDLILARLTPKRYEEITRAHVLDPTNTDAGRTVLWSHPAYANRSIYWRNDQELVCASLGQPK